VGRSLLIWLFSIGLSVAALVLTAAARQAGIQMAYAHLALSAVIAAVFAALAIGECRARLAAGAKYAEVAAINARSMGLVWTWGALALVFTYGTGVLLWREWWQYFAAFGIAGALCLIFAASLQKDAQHGKEDKTLLKLGRYLAVIQLAGMLIAMAGLLIDAKMTRFLNARYTDWAANNIFFFGAFAIAAISGFALKMNQPR
jgi:hypothetical protein